jgi:hypothetical protein
VVGREGSCARVEVRSGGEFSARGGKRMAESMAPRTGSGSGAWLSGLFDEDASVTQAT